MGRLFLGTSGYCYDDWRGVLYPPGLPERSWLAHYATEFSALELNATFYRLPSTSAVDGWRDATPERFIFAAKGSRYLTHLKRLRAPARGLDRYFARVDHLGHKLAVVLWQLPPQMAHPDPERLDHFLSRTPEDVRHAFDFRHPAWYTPEICDVLDAHGAAFVEHDLVDRAPPRPTGGFRYLRFHGATARHLGRYGGRRLAHTAHALAAWTAHGDAFVFFNNDRLGHAVRDARDFMRLAATPLTHEEPRPSLS
ncbi:MAG: DUF72 domain-containing protein [Deltaproteobacteria bacterium]|nr:DUF72 domain-containing protein [Deltaproteobacteria bacterium]